MGNQLITFGIVILVVGVLFNLLGKGGMPTLPGDIFYKKDNVTVYFPIVSSIILSVVLTIIFNLINRR